MNFLRQLICSECGRTFSADELQTLCPCGCPLYVEYDLARAAMEWDRSSLVERPPTLWRYAEVLPVRNQAYVISLGEGCTPLLHARSIGAELGLRHLYIKDEALNPTGSFKARGLSVAISRAKELGVREVVIPTAGNAGGALAAYAARAGLTAHIFMPRGSPRANIEECQIMGADVHLVDGLITEAYGIAARSAREYGWFNLSAMREPYRLEGKKTMGYEIAEQFGWELPEVIIYPTGGGTGMLGMWRAFDEMQELGWIGARRPRLIAVQASGCAPIVKALHEGRLDSEMWPDAQTIASGLCVPRPLADFLILRVLRKSLGYAIAVSDADILDAMHRLAVREGIFACPEGAATVAALSILCERELIDKDERVVCFNTGSGLKYTHLLGPQTLGSTTPR
jgi:threonine synthase